MPPTAARDPSKSRAFSIRIAATMAAVAVLAVAAVWLASSPRGSNASLIGGPFALQDGDGKTITEQSMFGRPFLVYFGYTHCPDVCPTSLFEISEVLRAMGKDADRVNAYYISVDPERDTSAAMKDYLSSFDSHLRGLTGNADAVAKVLSAYRVYAKKVPTDNGDYSMDHTALVYLMDKQGRFVAPFKLNRKPEDAAADLRRYL